MVGMNTRKKKKVGEDVDVGTKTDVQAESIQREHNVKDAFFTSLGTSE